MAENILLFVIFSLAFAIVYHVLPRSFKKYALLAANAVFYISISTYEWGGAF